MEGGMEEEVITSINREDCTVEVENQEPKAGSSGKRKDVTKEEKNESEEARFKSRKVLIDVNDQEENVLRYEKRKTRADVENQAEEKRASEREGLRKEVNREVKETKNSRKRKTPVDNVEHLENANYSERNKNKGGREKQALNGSFSEYELANEDEILDIKKFMESKRDAVHCYLQEKLKKSGLKVSFHLFCSCKKGLEGNITEKSCSFKTKMTQMHHELEIAEIYDKAIQKIVKESEDFEIKDSNWSIVRITKLQIYANKFDIIKGSGYIPTPKFIADKKAVTNVQNKDNECFRWAILASLHKQKSNKCRVKKYVKYYDEYNFENIDFPTPLDQALIFERDNDVTVNVFVFEENKNEIRNIIRTKEHKKHHANLLLVKDRTDPTKGHYCSVTSITRLLSTQASKGKRKVNRCDRCLFQFKGNVSSEDLRLHEESCNRNENHEIKLLTPKSKFLSFKNLRRKFPVPYVIYADFETMPVKIQTVEPSEDLSSSIPYQHHRAMGFCYYVVRSDGKYKPPEIYTGEDAAEEFVKRIIAETIKLLKDKGSEEVNLTQAEENAFQNATTCHICEKPFDDYDVVVRDHDHMTKRFRGAAHQECNVSCIIPNFVDVFIHNVRYDLCLFIRNLASRSSLSNYNIRVLPKSEEKFISIQVSNYKKGERFCLRFLDSMSFLSASLKTLVDNLPRDNMTHLQKHFADGDLDLVCQKGVYPYDYVDSIEKLEEKELPSRESFYNSIKQTGISEEEYARAREVWTRFGMKSLKEYTELYVKLDVLQLADVFESFRNLCLKTYGLDPAWYYTAPGLSWDAMLNHTGVRIELLHDVEMVKFVEEGIRGGFTQVSHRHAKANNKYMKEKYDPDQKSSYIMYLDVNNLYGWAMSQKLPLKDFEFCDERDWKKISEDPDHGYILEVDLHYPESLHDRHSDFPVAPEKRSPPGQKDPRLLATLEHKEKYVLHREALKHYLKLGLVLKKIHRVLRFEESAWLESYIALNSRKREGAENDFERDFYKLMNNCIFGKTIENIRKRVDVRVCTNPKSFHKLVVKENFDHCQRLDDDLVLVSMTRTQLFFDKPIAVGMSVLDLSKTFMYDFHYSKMLPVYGENLKLLYTDTDSLIYRVDTDDFYEGMKENLDWYDTSDYPDDNPYGIEKRNKKIVGKMKDEAKGMIYTEFVGVKSKMYAFKYDGGEVKKLKGVQRSVVDRDIHFDDYKKCIFQSEVTMVKVRRIDIKGQEARSILQNVVALTPEDHKRQLLDDKVSSLPYGHYSLKTEPQNIK